VVAVTCPPLETLAAVAESLVHLLNHERVMKTNLVGTSFGGYLAQYLVTFHPERIEKAVFSNTYAQPAPISRKYRLVELVLPVAPEWLVMAILRRGLRTRVYPARPKPGPALPYLLEQASGKLSKADILCRYRNVIEPFARTEPSRLNLPVLIIESDDDPLIEPPWRAELRAAYPSARVHTLRGGGHFPYLDMSETYTELLGDFFLNTNSSS
jgi:pimeloyl-ACP methyl ester carboxylesterase